MRKETEKLILTMLQNIDSELGELKGDVKELKQDVAVLKEEMKELKEDVAVLKEEVKELKEDVAVLKVEVKALKEDTEALKETVTENRTALNVLLEWTEEEVSENDSRFPKIGVTSFRKRTDVVLV